MNKSATFSQLMIDPPWPKRKGGLRSVRPHQGRELDYQTLTLDEIFSLLDKQILSKAQPLHNVFMWCIDQFLIEAEKRMLARGYKRHARFIWDKGNGVAPCFTVRYAHEYLLWFYRPKLKPIATTTRGKFTTVMREASREHTRKPDIAYDMVRSMYPADARLDVFSREAREGWVQWGDELEKFKS